MTLKKVSDCIFQSHSPSSHELLIVCFYSNWLSSQKTEVLLEAIEAALVQPVLAMQALATTTTMVPNGTAPLYISTIQTVLRLQDQMEMMEPLIFITQVMIMNVDLVEVEEEVVVWLNLLFKIIGCLPMWININNNNSTKNLARSFHDRCQCHWVGLILTKIQIR